MKKNPVRKKIKSRSTTQVNNNVIRVIEPLPPEATAKKLVAFSLALDSVVATATLTVDDSHTHLFLHWGDDTIEIINLRQLRILSPKVGENQVPNTLKFQHVYKPPFDQGRIYVSAETRDSEGKKSFDTKLVEVDPRYKISFYPITLIFPEHLDGPFETDSEMEVNMAIHQEGQASQFKQWIDDVTTAPQISTGEPIEWRLDGSAFSREISFSDEPIFLGLSMREHDGIGEEDSLINDIWDFVSSPVRLAYAVIDQFPLEFDGSAFINPVSMPLKIHPNFKKSLSRGKASFTLSDVYRLPEGKVIASFNYDLSVIIPLDQTLDQKMKYTSYL